MIFLIPCHRVTPDDQKLRKNHVEKRILVKENDSPGGIFQFANNTAPITSVTVRLNFILG